MVELEYRGTAFHGFQRQPGLPTVQGVLESALATYSGIDVNVRGAGRTDAGVHAVGQVAAFDIEGQIEITSATRSLNALMAGDAAITQMVQVPDEFDPRRDAIWREYRYFILNRLPISPLLEDFTHHHMDELDAGLFSRGCHSMAGEHDFSAFRVGTEEKNTTRTVLECRLDIPRDDIICLVVRAESFLYRMVRIMAGALVEVGSGRMGLEELEEHLAGGEGPCAPHLPGRGLFLWEIAYPKEVLGL